MAFAIFYEDEDAAIIGGTMSRADLTQQERQLAQKIWNGGLKDWATQPFALSPTCDDPNTFPIRSRRCVIDAPNVTKADLVAMLQGVAARIPGDQGNYLIALAFDVEQCGQEPA